METKKANHVNLEKKRSVFLQLGFVIALTLILMAFEWSVEKSAVKVYSSSISTEFEEDIINTFREKPEKIERPEPKPTITQIFEIIDNDEDIDDVLVFSSESDENDWSDTEFTLDPEPPDEWNIFVWVEEMPIFRPAINKTEEQGDADLHRYAMRLARYPELARIQGIEGRVWVQFVVDEKGKVTNVKIERGVDRLLDDEALRVVRSLPDFSPGLQRSKAVKVLYRVPINFRLG